MPDIFIASSEKTQKQDHNENTVESNNSKNDTYAPKSMFIDSEPATAFSNFKLRPNNVHFEHQLNNEHVYLFVRRHHITNLPWTIIGFVLIIIPLIFFILSPSSLIPFSIPFEYVFVLTIFYYACVFSYLFINYLSWFFNVSLVTEERVVDIDFSGLLYSDVAVTKLNLIEDVNSVKSGFIRSLFNYGDVFLQTAGEKAHFDFLKIPHPEKAADIVQNLIGGDRYV